MRNKMLAAAAATASLVLAATAAGTADASQHEPAARVSYFKTKVTPSSGVTSGTTVTSKGSGAEPSTAYYCLLAVYDADGGGVSAPNESTLRTVRSNARGKISCSQTYRPFSAEDNRGVTRHCPTTRADKRAHFKCGVVMADVATVGAISATAAAFSPR